MKKENFKKLVTNDIVKLENSIEPIQKTTDDILNELLKTIGKLDFEILAFTDIESLKEEIHNLKAFVFNPDGSLNKEK